MQRGLIGQPSNLLDTHLSARRSDSFEITVRTQLRGGDGSENGVAVKNVGPSGTYKVSLDLRLALAHAELSPSLTRDEAVGKTRRR